MSSLDTTLAAGRREAEARMRDQVRLYKQAPDVFDRTTGTTVAGLQTDLYIGKARVRGIAQASGEDQQAGEREVVLREYEVAVPWATTLPMQERLIAGARVEVTSSPDPRMAGLILWVTGAKFADQATAWRISVEDRS